MKRGRFWAAAATAVLAAAAVSVAPALSEPVSGAIFTTDSTCAVVNGNIYDTKQDVYINGGPAHPGAAGLPNGEYYVQVTDPSGATVLGTSLGSGDETPVTVVDGEFIACLQLWAILVKGSDATEGGYDNTPNPGGEYKVWVSTVSTFDNDSTKTDNFKVRQDGCEQDCVPVQATLNAIKFYDANLNGINDDGVEITGWRVTLDGTDTKTTPASWLVAVNSNHTVTEGTPIQANWIHTTPTSVNVFVPAAGATVEFGNVCVGGGGGLTLGFWSNKNGQALFGSGDLALMVSLNLRNANGSNFDPANYAGFRTWLVNATATNMAYMLSAQLAAMELNVYNGFVDGTDLIYAPGATSANSLGFATVNAVMAEANTELGAHGVTLVGSAYRAYQEALKTALDKANNNLNFLQDSPCAFSFAS